MSMASNECPHEWMSRGTAGDRWQECLLCGAQEDAPRPQSRAERMGIADSVRRIRESAERKMQELPDGV